MLFRWLSITSTPTNDEDQSLYQIEVNGWNIQMHMEPQAIFGWLISYLHFLQQVYKQIKSSTGKYDQCELLSHHP